MTKLEIGGMCMTQKDSRTALELKKQTLTAWTRILHGRSEIDTQKYNRMLVLIDKLTA